MEDCHVLIDDLNAEFPDIFKDGIKRSFYAVFDGHGGKNTAIFIRNHLLQNIVRNQHFISDPEAAIRKGFFKTDEDVLETQRAEGWCDGSTAAIAFLIGDQCWVANSGDSEVVLGRKEEDKYIAKVMSVIHRPDTKEEHQRLAKIQAPVNHHRVAGTLAVSRAFGDGPLKEGENGATEDWVTAEPSVCVHKVAKGDLLILACDGLWDVFSHSEALQLALDFLFSSKEKDQRASLDRTCEQLVEEALRKGSTDNVTCVLVSI